MEWMPQAIREGIFTILFISGPLVILAAGLGLSVGIVQAATQVQEQTLGSAVKILGLFLAIIVFGFYMFGYMRDYTADNINRAFSIVPKLGTHVLPRRNFIDVPSNQELLNPFKSIPAPPIQEDSFKKAPAIADDLKSPDFEIKQGDRDDSRVGLPEMQRKKIGDSNIIKQDSSGAAIREDEFRQDNNTNFVSTPTTVAPVQATNTITSPASNTTTRPAQEAVRDDNKNQESLINNLGNEPVVRPRQRRSITDSLNKLRESIDEFNQDNKDTQGVFD
jgi:flagellar biosynthesis protein FliQ